jgi:hypothetical protein
MKYFNQNQFNPQTLKKMNPTKSFYKLATAAAIITSTLLTAATAGAGSSSLVIAEVYGGGGNSGSVYKNDFIVVFNRSASDVNVNGWSVQYASATGTSWQVTTLASGNKTIPPGGYFLVQEAAGTGGTTSLPTPDATGTINLSGTAGKVALVNNNTALSGTNGTGPTIVDFVGFGTTANGYEGSGPAPQPGTAAVSDQRASSGCTDTDNNNTDFALASANPRNSATPTHSCATVVPPVIASIYPASLTANAGTAVNFTVTNSAGDIPLSYFWYKETASSTNLVSVVTTNTTAGTLTLPNVLLADAANYQAVVSNASYVTVTSAVVSLSVTDPAINVEPESQTGLPHQAVQFAVTTGGTGLSYRWYYCTDPNDNTFIASPVNNGTQPSGSIVSGATSSVLMITNLQASDPTNFVVVVTGTYGPVISSVASLTLSTTQVPLALWTFNGLFNVTSPAPYQGIGTASAVNVDPFVQPTQDGNDFYPGPNTAWGTQNYPAQGVSSKQAGVRFDTSTVGAKNIAVSYDIRGTATASKYERLQFTINGTDFIDYPASSIFGSGAYETRTFNLSGFPGVANNPSFGIRIVTEFESTAKYNNTNNANYVPITSTSTYGTSGTLSFDLVTITADAITTANSAPTLSALANVTMQDTVGAINNFTVNDDSTPAGSLNITAISLDSTIHPSLTVNNVNGACKLTINSSLGNPTTNNVPILVTVTDANGDSTVGWFTLTITPANAPPVITGLINTNILPNATLVVPFTLTDDHTAPGTITPTVFSGNTTLVPNDTAHLALGGSGTSRTLTITPAANQLGTVPITVSASDGSLNTAQTIFLTVRPNTNVVLIDNFGYDGSGAMTILSGGFWQNHSGTPNQLQVGSGVATIDGTTHTEDINAPLIGQPYTTNSGTVLYSSFVVSYTTLPDSVGAYFAHFKDNTIYGFLARVWATTNHAAPGTYRIAIGNNATTNVNAVQFPQDLVLNSNYVIVTRLVLSNAFSTVWINPNSESSPGVTDTTDITTNKVNIYSYAFRESNVSEGTVNVSHLRIGLTFDSVLPSLCIRQLGNNMILDCSDPTLCVQSATNVAGPYVDLPGYPNTNNAGVNNMMFFRFKR